MNMLPKRTAAGLAALFVGAALTAAPTTNSQLNDLRGLQLNNAKIPVLNQGRLQMVIFSSKAERRGEMMIGFDTVLAIIRNGADADSIRDDWGLVSYALGAPLRQVLDFWKIRMKYCEGIMHTPEAEIDNAGRRASGNRDVHFRSPMLDLDGVGFEADFDRRTISVNSQVRIVLRQENADPAVLLKDPGKIPAKYVPIRASADSMLIDTKRNEVMLIGNVRVDEEQRFLTCDRLTIFWKSNSGQKRSAEIPEGAELHNAGLDRILADGNVVITNRNKPKERIFADHLICNVPRGTAKLSGDDAPPRLVSANGEVLSGAEIYFERDTKRGHITGGCRLDGAPEKDAKGKMVVLKKLTSRNGFFDFSNNLAEFTGDVKMRDGEHTVTCDRMRIVLAESGRKTPAAPRSGAKPDADSILGSTDLDIGGKELRSADCLDRVLLVQAGGARLSSDKMHAEFVPGGANNIKSADFRGGVTMVDASKNRLNCEEAHIEFASGGATSIKSADCYGGVKMVDASKNQLSCDTMRADFAPGKDGGIDLAQAKWFRNVRAESAGSAGTPPGVITADCAEFDNRANRVTFESNVNGKREKATLKCHRLDVYLGGKKNPSAAAKAPAGSIAIGAGGDRIIRKTVAAGKVRVTDESGTLDCDKLTLFFTELPPGAKPEPGMFQSGGARLTDIIAEGHVVAVNHASADSKKQPGLLAGRSKGARRLYADYTRADLVRHLSHLKGNVRIRDDENMLLCDDMYLYGVRKAPMLPDAKGKTNGKGGKSAVEDDPDADPFALPGFNEDTVPSVINITDDVQLKKVLCLGNVKLERTDPDTKHKQEAGGGRCVYMPERRVATLTDTPPRRPWVRAEGRQQYGSRIVYDLNENIFKSYDTDSFTIEPGQPTP